MDMSTSQKMTLGYAALVGAGGLMGFVKGGSKISVVAGGLSASALYYVYTELPERPGFASSVGLGVSAALVGAMGSRYQRTRKVFPAGVVALLSLGMSGAYIHVQLAGLNFILSVLCYVVLCCAVLLPQNRIERWQQLLINRVVGYDTILMNSLLSFPGEDYLCNYQTNKFYNLSLAHEPSKGSANLGDYLVMKCGVLMMSLFVFFQLLLQLQHHAPHRLPTFQLIFVHVIESLVFVPIMIGILFFLFEFYDDQLLAFMVLILVWLCELFTLIREQ